MIEELGVEARLVQNQDGGLNLGIYCSNCAAGIALVVLEPADVSLDDEFDWQADNDVRRAINRHHRKHAAPPA
jgi:hypothetical protein